MRKKIITMAVTLLAARPAQCGGADGREAADGRRDGANAGNPVAARAKTRRRAGSSGHARWTLGGDEEAPKVETLINHEATDDVRFTLSRLVAALEMGDRDGAFVYARRAGGRHRAYFGAADAVVAEFAVKRRTESVFTSTEVCKASKNSLVRAILCNSYT